MASKEKNCDLPMRLFEQLRQYSGYTFDVANPIYQPTWDTWQLQGLRHARPISDTVKDKSPRPQTSNGRQKSSTNLTKIGGLRSPSRNQQPVSSSANDTSENPSLEQEDGQVGFNIPVFARISNHTLRIEREYQKIVRIQNSGDPECTKVIRPFDMVHLTSSGLIASIYENPGENALSDYFSSVNRRNGFGESEKNEALSQSPSTEPEQIMPLHLFLTFAIGACECLEILHHGSHSVHGEIREDAFHFSREDGSVRFLNFGSGPTTFENGLNSVVWGELSKQSGIEDKLMYMAPEQTGRMSQNPDSRTDIYSMGILFYVLLSRKRPFESNDPMEIVQSVLSKKLPAIHSTRMDIPELLTEIVQKMTSKQIEKRYFSATGLKYDIKNLQSCLASDKIDDLKDFTLGSKDIISFFRLPSVMLGREEPYNKIVKILSRMHKHHARAAQWRQGVRDINSAQNASNTNPDSLTDSLDSWSVSSGEQGNTSSSRDSTSLVDNAGSTTEFSARATASLRESDGSGPGSLALPSVSTRSQDLNSVAPSEKNSRAAVSNNSSTNSTTLVENVAYKRRGRCEVISISGPAGIGKSLLLSSIQTEARRRGYFASAKFDRSRQRPFETILKVISSVFKQMLTESEDVIGELSYNVRAFLKPQWVSLHRALDLPDLNNVFHTDKNANRSGHVSYSTRTPSETETSETPIKNSSNSMFSSDVASAGGNKMRFRSMLLELLRMLSKAKLLCLCLDDLQLADQESMDLLTTIVTSRARLILIVTYRDNEIDPSKVRSVLASDRSNLTQLKLRELSEDLIKEYLTMTLHQPKEATRPLAAILTEKTQGNPFYMREMLHTCFIQGTIVYDWRSSAWTYDFDTIFNLFVSGDFQGGSVQNDFVAKRFHEIKSRNVRKLLAWASLLGSTFSFRFIKKLFYYESRFIPEESRNVAQPNNQMTTAIDDAVEALQHILEIGLVIPTDDEDIFRFAHDRYLYAAGELREIEPRANMHLAIAQLMIEEQTENKLDFSFSAESGSRGNYNVASHICESASVIKEYFSSRKQFRKILLRAADKSTENGAHYASIDFYMTAISLLQENPWEDTNEDCNYEETLNLYNKAAESLWYQNSRRITEVLQLAKVVLENGRNVMDKIPSWILLNRVLLQTRKFEEALNTMQECLKLLDCDISHDWTWENCDIEYASLKKCILDEKEKTADKGSLSQDSVLLALGPVLFETSLTAYIISMELFYQIGLKMVRLYLERGAYTEAGLGFIYMGSLALHRYNDPIFASELAELGTTCLDKYGDVQTNGRGTVLYMSFLSHLKIHVSVAATGLNTALEYNVAAGDRLFAAFTLANVAVYKLYASEDLREIDAYCKYAMEEISTFSEEPDPPILLLAVRQTVKALIGRTNYKSAYEVFDDDTHNSDLFINAARQVIGDKDYVLNPYLTFKVMTLYLFGHFEKAVELGNQCIKALDLTPAQRDTRMLLFYYSLSLISAIRENPEVGNYSETIQKVKYYKASIEAWTATSDINYRPLIEILAAETNDVEGNYFDAARSYEIALDACQENGFALEEALTYELAGEFYIRRGIKRASQNFIKEAATTYTQLGASAKTTFLHTRHGKAISTTNVRSQDAGCQTDLHLLHSQNMTLDQYHLDQEHAGDANGGNWIPPQREGNLMMEDAMDAQSNLLSPITLDTLDLNTIITSSRVISSEVELETLLAKMVRIVLDNMGSQADSVSIIVKEEDQYLVAAIGNVDTGVKTYQPGQPLSQSDVDASSAVILYILRTHETLFIHNIIEDERFANTSEEWLTKHPQGKSVIAMPIVNNRSELVGVLYLEGTVNAFTDRNLVVLSYLTSQIGISITNALLFASVRAVSRTNYAMIESLNNALAKAQESKERADKATEEAIRNMKLKEEASRAKSEFLANVSHELRTPLSGVVGICELLRSTDLTTEQGEMTESMRKCADTLLTVINDILDYSKIEAGKMKLFNVPFYLVDNIHEVVQALSYANTERNVKIIENLNIPRELVLGDPARIHQVIMNLLSNAFKFCTEGSITIYATKDAEDDMSITSKVSVVDTGIGVDEETLNRLFSPFSQADSSTGKRFGGTGLGLSICKSLITNMGGTIGMTSELGKGTTVSFQIKFQRAPLGSGPHDNTMTPLDPDPMSQYNRTVVAQTQDPSTSPVNVRLAHVEHLASISRDDLRLLLVEDNPINQKIALSFIRKLKFHVDAVDNGQQAVDALRACAKAGKPYHLVLMDIMMPVMDGYTACKLLRKDMNPDVSNVCVIAMTASATRGDRERCIGEAGMDDYLAKPVRAAVLKNMLEKYLGRGEATGLTSAAAKVVEATKLSLAAKESIDLVKESAP